MTDEHPEVSPLAKSVIADRYATIHEDGRTLVRGLGDRVLPAISFLKESIKVGMIPQDVVETIMATYHLDPDGWWVDYHFFWGMSIRNLLREGGYGEKQLGVENLDDIYVVLLERALGLEDESGPVK